MSSKFEIFKSSKNGQFYFRLKAGNGEIILASEGYIAKDGCRNGIDSVKRHSPYDYNYQRLFANNGQYYFTLRAANGQVIGNSELYVSSQGRENGIESVKRNAPLAVVVDLATTAALS